MSQPDVERVIGRLVTDEAFRGRFVADVAATLDELTREGIRLNPCERHALAGLDLEAVRGFVDRLDPRIQKSDLRRSRCE
jgi:hypothetical protein